MLTTLPAMFLGTTTSPGPSCFSLVFGLWSLWTNRNCVTYQAKQPNPLILKECVAKTLEYQFLTALAKNPHLRVRINTKWTKPDSGWLKLNTNASIINGHAGVGGLIRDSNGNWVEGFSKSIGTSSVLMAELWAMRDGIRMAKSLNIQSLLINMDCSEVVNLITSHSSTNRLTQP